MVLVKIVMYVSIPRSRINSVKDFLNEQSELYTGDILHYSFNESSFIDMMNRKEEEEMEEERR